jgi:hypothetical protein
MNTNTNTKTLAKRKNNAKAEVALDSRSVNDILKDISFDDTGRIEKARLSGEGEFCTLIDHFDRLCQSGKDNCAILASLVPDESWPSFKERVSVSFSLGRAHQLGQERKIAIALRENGFPVRHIEAIRSRLGSGNLKTLLETKAARPLLTDALNSDKGSGALEQLRSKAEADGFIESKSRSPKKESDGGKGGKSDEKAKLSPAESCRLACEFVASQVADRKVTLSDVSAMLRNAFRASKALTVRGSFRFVSEAEEKELEIVRNQKRMIEKAGKAKGE